MLLNEIWKDIPNYEGLYQISDLGRIKSLHWGKEKILKQTIRSKNYPYYFIGLLKDKKRKYYAIHRLVAEVFVANPNKYTQVDHIDGNKLNNNINNLEYVTQKDNCIKAWEQGLCENVRKGAYKQIHKKEIKTSREVIQFDFEGNEINRFVSLRDAERQTGINNSNIIRCCQGKNNNAGGYLWKYANIVQAINKKCQELRWLDE